MLAHSRRLVAAFLAPLYALVTAAPATFHQCSMHSAAAGAMSGAAKSPAGHAEHSAHAGHAMMEHGTAAANSGAESGHGSMPAHSGANSCSCDDGCCVTSVATTAPRVSMLVVPEAIRRETPLLLSTGVAATSPQLVLPFANGPPARV